MQVDQQYVCTFLGFCMAPVKLSKALETWLCLGPKHMSLNIRENVAGAELQAIVDMFTGGLCQRDGAMCKRAHCSLVDAWQRDQDISFDS